MEKESHPSHTSDLSSQNPDKIVQPRRFSSAHIIAFLVLLLLWVIFSGRFDAFHLVLGIICSALVTVISGDLMFTSHETQGIFRLWLRMAGYIPWLLYQIFKANLHVLYLTFHPRMLDIINPQIIRFDSRLKSDYSRMVFANSITLTPGTITVDVNALGRFSVHCIDEPSGQPLPGEMEEKIAAVFTE